VLNNNPKLYFVLLTRLAGTSTEQDYSWMIVTAGSRQSS
jgi:hypothetical protein